jgi:hypothetical protein
MLSQLHAELAGKLIENRNAAVKIKTAMLQVEAVLQMLQVGHVRLSLLRFGETEASMLPLTPHARLLSISLCIVMRIGGCVTSRWLWTC